MQTKLSQTKVSKNTTFAELLGGKKQEPEKVSVASPIAAFTQEGLFQQILFQLNQQQKVNELIVSRLEKLEKTVEKFEKRFNNK